MFPRRDLNLSRRSKVAHTSQLGRVGRGLGPLVSCSQIPNDTGLVNRRRTERFQIYNRAEEAVSVRNLTPERLLFAQLATKLSQ
jgi:hypothetical protein